jgi:hypothetical protein
MGNRRNTKIVTARKIALAAFLAVLLTAGTAAAQTPGEAEPETKAIALVQRAIPLQLEERHDEALVLLDRAATLSSHPKVLFLRARSLFALRRYEEARSLYRTLPIKTAELEEDLIEEVRQNLKVCDELLIETMVHFVTPQSDGAAIAVDGLAVGTSPVSKGLRRGTYQVKASREGYTDAEKVVTVRGDKQVTVLLVLAKIDDKPITPPPTIVEGNSTSGRTWAWVTLGSGAAALVGGGLFLGNYVDKTTRKLQPNQRVEGEQLDLGLGISMAVAGVGLAATSAFLFAGSSDRKTGPTATLIPFKRGCGLGFTWGGW